MKRKSSDEPQSVGQAIRELLNSYRLTSRFDETHLISSWERIAGKPIARRTKKIYMRDRVLFVELDSAAMRHDFSLHKAKVLEMLHQEFGANAVADIVAM